MSGVMLGRNHPDYGKPLDFERPSRAKERMTLPEIVRAYAREHDRRSQGYCRCFLCNDLRWHIQQSKPKREAQR